MQSNINQDLLVQKLKGIFYETPVVNSRKASSLKYGEREKGLYLELDVWYPRRDICFEFQDAYHYVTTWYFHENPKKIQQRDFKKRDEIHKVNLTLIVVPCWWDGSIKSLKSLIYFHRPDLVRESDVPPIPLNPPKSFFKANEIEDVGELMYASFPIDPSVIRYHFWWIGEKYDGIRFCWNPKQQTLYSRNGSIFSLIPPPVTDPLPPIYLDGEFWFGRGGFEHTSNLVNDDNETVEWSLLRMIAFDVPTLYTQQQNTSLSPYESRYSLLLLSLSPSHPNIIVASRFVVWRYSPFKYFIHLITDNEGEGIILQKLGSLYEHGRSLSLLKIKNTQVDKEATVVGFVHNSPQLLLPNGTIFSVLPENVKLNQQQREELKIGSIVTFVYEKVARSDMPANPVIMRVRRDLDWGDVVKSSSEQEALNPERKFLENLAKSNNMDPLSPHTWYKIGESKVVARFQRGKQIISKYQGYSRAVRALFPEINFNFSKFKASWREIKNRRRFFEKYAKENSFDPLIPENWYHHVRHGLVHAKGVRGIVKYHKYSYSLALLDLFPDIGLDPIKLRSSWTTRDNKRRFLEQYAKHHAFDPLVASNWTSISTKQFLAYKRGGSILRTYQGSLTRALLDLFPNIGLSLSPKTNTSWKDPAKRRKFFIEYATSKGFDALNPDHWYSHPLLKVKEKSRSVLFYHNYSVSKALMDLFPDIGLDKSKFTKNSKV